MNIKRIFITSIITISLIIPTGVLVGCDKDKKEIKSQTPEKKDSISVSEQIAVVNEDTGIEYPSGTVNYSDEFIKTLDGEKFIVTSSNDAEIGLKNGSYAGILMFPANLSYKILNINYGNPEQIKLNYVISDIADKDVSDKTHTMIIESYQDFNNRLSYAYINALMEEIEQGQSEVGKIFGNDKSILEAAEKFTETDLDTAYKSPDLPKNNISFKEHNTDEYRKNGVNYANDVDKLYKDAYTDAYNEQTQVKGNIPDIQSVKDAAAKMKALFSQVQDYDAELKAFTGTELLPYEDVVNGYVKAVGTYMGAVDSYVAEVEAYKSLVDTSTAGLDPSIRESLAKAGGDVINMGNNLKADGSKPNSEDVEKIPTFSPEKTLPTEAEYNSALTDFNGKTDSLYKTMETLSENLKPENMINRAMTTGSGQTYKEKIDEKKSNFTSETDAITKSFNDIQRQNLKKLTDSYEKNNKYMTETVDSLNKKREKDRDNLKSGLDDFLKTAKSSSADTKNRLESFRKMLEKAKVEGRVSSAVVEFLIQPIQLKEYNVN